MIPLALASQQLQGIIPELMQLHSFYSIMGHRQHADQE
jgi:hypothetical protein